MHVENPGFRRLIIWGGLALAIASLGAFWNAHRDQENEAWALGVMDPLAKPLACACVKGYAQRDYDQLGEYLGRALGRQVRVIYGEDLQKVIRQAGKSQLMLVIGKESVVRTDAEQAGLQLNPIGRLTGKDGSTTLTGLFAVKTSDPARTVADLKGRRLFFGPKDSDEKYAAAMTALQRAGVPLPSRIETRPGCSDAGMDVQDSTENPPPACVISSYALPLLEGCGNIERGSLRIVGQTGPVPFVTAFVSSSIGVRERAELQKALLASSQNSRLLTALESRDGFVELGQDNPDGWPGWRGANRDGLVEWLPDHLPASRRFVWERPLPGSGLGGIAVAQGRVFAGARDLADSKDVFLCLDAENGAVVWERAYPAPGALDYGQSPRTTPMVHDGKVYFLGALGDLACVRCADGTPVWELNLVRRFAAPQPKWGFAASPLIVGERLILNPGATNASLVALNCSTGELMWASPGSPAAYASMIFGIFGGRRQIVGYDVDSLGGWDPETGRRLWRLVPPKSGDFNVPTPLSWRGRLIVATENNGTRIYGFNRDGTIKPKPEAICNDLAPDVNTPVVLQDRLFGCQEGFYCLDLRQGLKPVWKASQPAFADFVALLGGGDRVLLSTYRGELLLVSATASECQVLSRLQVFDNEAEVFSHPALVDGRLYIRGTGSIGCLDLRAGMSPTASVRSF